MATSTAPHPTEVKASIYVYADGYIGFGNKLREALRLIEGSVIELRPQKEAPYGAYLVQAQDSDNGQAIKVCDKRGYHIHNPTLAAQILSPHGTPSEKRFALHPQPLREPGAVAFLLEPVAPSLF